MALICITGGKECIGCGRCYGGRIAFHCSVCGEEIFSGSDYFDIGGLKICEECISTSRKEAE